MPGESLRDALYACGCISRPENPVKPQKYMPPGRCVPGHGTRDTLSGTKAFYVLKKREFSVRISQRHAAFPTENLRLDASLGSMFYIPVRFIMKFF